MSDTREPMALVHHAVQVADWKLLELVAQMLAGGPRSARMHAAPRAYRTLVMRLGLVVGPDYDRG